MKGRKARAVKKREEKKLQEQHRLAEKRRLERVLSALGLLAGFRELPGAAREVIGRGLPGRPQIVIAPGSEGSAALRGLKAEVEERLGGVTMVTAEGRSLPLLDFLSVCGALPAGFASLKSAPLSRDQRAFAEHAAATSVAFLRERADAAVRWVSCEVPAILLMHSRIDGRVFGCRLQRGPSSPGKPAARLVLQESEPRVERIEVDGKLRPAFQFAVPWGLDGIRWVDCDGAPFGLDGGRRYPLFLQAHAFRRLRERLAPSPLPDLALQVGLSCSLAELTVVERQGDSHLIAFHVRGVRVGYLVARVVRDRVVITTFLFLTMEGTPEGRLLRQKLRLTRPDIEYQGLDRLETFLAPDVLADQDLVGVLEECGCGSLLALARDGFPHTAAGGHAEDLKRFLGITEGGDQGLARRFLSPPKRVG